MAGEEKLRDEMRAFEAERQQLTRWKLVGLGALAAIGMGVEGSSKQGMLPILSLIPLFTAYCDLINSEYEIRIALIAAFFRKRVGPYDEYELFYQSDKVQATEWWKVVRAVNIMPSIFACLLVYILGLCIILFPNIIAPSPANPDPLFTAIVLMGSAVTGAVLTSYIDSRLKAMHEAILHI